MSRPSTAGVRAASVTACRTAPEDRPVGSPAGEGRLIVGIAASSAERYLSTALFDGL